MANDDAKRPDLELEVGVGVPVELRHLVRASSIFAGLINEVAEARAERPGPIRWLVEVKEGSVRLPLRAELAHDDVEPSLVQEIPAVIAEGIAQLEREPVRPQYFSDKALEQVKSLANLATADFPLAVRNGHERAAITKQAYVNAEKVLGRPRRSFGSIEGRLDALDIHAGQEFAIWPLGGKKVKCSFGEYVELEDVLAAVGKRVAARGEIQTKPNGERIIQVHSLRVLGQRQVSVDDVRGVFKDHALEDW